MTSPASTAHPFAAERAAPFNTADLLRARAAERPGQAAVVVPARGGGWTTETFAGLDARVDRYAHALAGVGVQPGERVVLLVPPGVDMIALCYALLRTGAVLVLIDPGMGPEALVRCIEQVRPQGLVAIGKAHLALSVLARGLVRGLKHRVKVGGGPLPGGSRLDALAAAAPATRFAPARPTTGGDVAAVLFTSGSTGPAKGAVYEHRMFGAQARHLQRVYGIEPGEVDVEGLPVFALFSVALGATVVLPDMDFTRPARLDPARFVAAIEDHRATYSFGSPAIWGPVARWCVERGKRLPTMRRVLSAGVPVPPWMHEALGAVLPAGAEVHTPYGATEALPVASVRTSEIAATFADTRAGRGTCVGEPVAGVDVRVIRTDDAPIAAWSDDLVVPAGTVGELCVAGDVVTERYLDLEAATAAAKIVDPTTGRVWHRMGDLGFTDEQGRLWFCGRKGHRVETTGGATLLSVNCEAVFDEHPRVARVALVGVGAPGAQRPVLVVEPKGREWPRDAAAREAFVRELLALGAARPHTAAITEVLFHHALPVDVRHNAKIRREVLATWAIAGTDLPPPRGARGPLGAALGLVVIAAIVLGQFVGVPVDRIDGLGPITSASLVTGRLRDGAPLALQLPAADLPALDRDLRRHLEPMLGGGGMSLQTVTLVVQDARGATRTLGASAVELHPRGRLPAVLRAPIERLELGGDTTGWLPFDRR